MMKNFVLSILMLFLSTFVWFSCHDNVDDNEKPTIQTSFKDNDTLWISARDTNYFSVELQDNEALSTYKVQIECLPGIDTLNGDTTKAAIQKLVYQWSLYGDKYVNRTDSFSIPIVTSYKGRKYSVKEGGIESYRLIFGCIDYYGNYDSVVYKINLMYADSLKKE